jgi:hypothetical protein
MFVSPHPSKEAQLDQTFLDLRPLSLVEKFEEMILNAQP